MKRKKELIQILIMGNKVAVYSMTGNLLKMFKVSVSYQKEIASFLCDNEYRISKMQASNFPYLEGFTS